MAGAVSALLGVSATPATARAHLSKPQRAALRITKARVVNASSFGLIIEVRFKGRFDRLVGKGRLSTGGVAVGLFPKAASSASTRSTPPARAEATAPPPVVVALEGRRHHPSVLQANATGPIAVDRRARTVTFFIGGVVAWRLRSIIVVSYRARKGSHLTAAAAGSQDFTTMEKEFVVNFRLEASGFELFNPRDPGDPVDCRELRAAIDEARRNQEIYQALPPTEGSEYDYNAATAVQFKAWADKAEAYYQEHCGPPALGPIGPEEFGAALTEDPATVARATYDFLLWLAQQAAQYRAEPRAASLSPAAPAAGKITRIQVRGNYVPGACPLAPDSTCQTIHFQDLRPQPNGAVQVINTSEAFTLPATPGTYSFAPTNLCVKAGDFVGLATPGGSFKVLAPASGAITDMFGGHGQDHNGATFNPSSQYQGQQLNMHMTVQPGASPC